MNTMKVRLLALAQFRSYILHTLGVEPENRMLGIFFFLEETKELKKLRYEVGLQVLERMHLPLGSTDSVISLSLAATVLLWDPEAGRVPSLMLPNSQNSATQGAGEGSFRQDTGRQCCLQELVSLLWFRV